MRRYSIAIILICGLAWHADFAPAADAQPGRSLRLNAATLDTDRLPNLKRAPARDAPTRTCIVQFDGPLDGPTRRALARDGQAIGEYLCENAFVVRMDGPALARLAARHDVRWITPFERGWKLDPELGRRTFTTAERQTLRAQGQSRILVTLFGDRPAGPVVAALQRLPGAIVHYTERVGGNETVLATIPSQAAVAPADLDDVQYVEEAPELTLRNNTVRWIVQTNVNGVTPFYTNGITGTDQIIGILDSRVDSNHCSFLDAANPIGPLHRKILAYNATLGAAGHGTFVAGVATGDSGAFDDKRGVAYGAKLVYGDFTTSFSETGIYTNLTTHHNQGARVHTNSWGNDGTTNYDGLCRGIDSFAYDNEDDLILFAVTNQSNLRNPENAKNLVAVAACGDTPNQEFHCKGGTGPTVDGRRKPEVFAPGCGTSSSQANTVCGVQSFGSGIGGTSYACPGVAGAAVLLRQYFISGFYPSGTANGPDAITPSGALMKAMIINSSVDMSGLGGYPGVLEGWGRLQADVAAYFTGDSRKLHVFQDLRNASGLTTGQENTYQFAVNGSAEQLRVTLVWTDAPASASTGTANAAINNLDLEVLTPGGATYKGNVFSGGVSATGGSADAINNVEQVHLNSPTPGIWTVKVKATGIPVGAQGFALIATGQVGPYLPAPTISGITPATSDVDTFVGVTDLAGTGFQTGASVKLTRSGYPDIPAESVVAVSPTQITCGIDLTAAPIGPWNVVVTNPDTQSGALTDGFMVTGPEPTVSSITPAMAQTGSIVSVTSLTGTNFVAGASVRLTKMGEADITAGSVVVVSPTEITCSLDLAGAAPGAWDVVVTNVDLRAGTLAGGFTITPPPPMVLSIEPTMAVTGTVVMVTDLAGTGFQDGAAVKLQRIGHSDIVAASVVVASPTQITCTFDLTGAAAGLWDVVVTNPDMQTGTLPNGFSIILPAPVVTSITPSSGTQGAVVNVTDLAGSNFVDGAGVKLTRIGEPDIVASSVVVVTSSQITCALDLTGAAAGAWNVVVTNPDTQSATLTDGFTVVLPPPGIASITPASGITGTIVPVTDLAGTNFVAGAAVKLTRMGEPDIVAGSVVVVSAIQITCTLDLSGAAIGAWSVVVTNPDTQTASLPDGFTVTPPPAPAPGSILPAAAITGTMVSITDLAGSDFVTGAEVKLTRTGETDIPATSVVVVSPAQITCSLDLAGAAVGAWDVVVTNPDMQSGTLPGGFDVLPIPPPSVSQIVPSGAQSGSIANISNLAGANFQAGATVKLTRTGESDIAGASVVVVSDVQITCTFDLSGAAVGPWNVVVTNPDLQSGSQMNGFQVFQSCLKADMNDDSVVDGLDVQRFIDRLIGGGADPRESCAGDVAPLRDGVLTEDDLPAFVDCILGGGCT